MKLWLTEAADCLLRGSWRSHLQTLHERERKGNYSCTFSLLSVHAFLTQLMLCFLSLQICWEHVAQICLHLLLFFFFFFFFLQETSHNFSLQCQMHANVAPNSLWCMSFPQGSAGVPGQPGEPGKEGKRVSKQKQSTSCVAWLVFVLAVRTWPGERPNSSWVVFVVLGEAKMICGPAKSQGEVRACCMTINE